MSQHFRIEARQKDKSIGVLKCDGKKWKDARSKVLVERVLQHKNPIGMPFPVQVSNRITDRRSAGIWPIRPARGNIAIHIDLVVPDKSQWID